MSKGTSISPDSHQRFANLCVPRLICLNTLQHSSKAVVATLRGVGRKCHELQIRERLLKAHVEHYRGGSRIAGVGDVVERVAQTDDNTILCL